MWKRKHLHKPVPLKPWLRGSKKRCGKLARFHNSIAPFHLMQLPAPLTRAVRVLGVDDFAWKKRFTYGTILVDLERRKIIDVRGFSRKCDRRSLVKRASRSSIREQRSWQGFYQSGTTGRTASAAG